MNFHSIKLIILAWLYLTAGALQATIVLGVDALLAPENAGRLKGKRIGLITNNSSVNSRYQTTIAAFKEKSQAYGYKIQALFAPEHGINVNAYASALLADEVDPDGIPIFSLHGKYHKPTAEMLKDIDLLIFDIQDVGTRTYTYITTLFKSMEAASENQVAMLVLDRPNPINGMVVDGPMLQKKWFSNIGYANIPFCHGMTVAELALFYHKENQLKNALDVIPMKGWKRTMTFADTGLAWMPTSPYMPEVSTPLYYPTTNILGDMGFVNIGIGYTLPFKVVGAPWIQAEQLARTLNAQKLPGVHFHPFYFEPFYGRYQKQPCQGVMIVIKDPLIYQPVTTQYTIIGMLKSLYPKPFEEAVEAIKEKKDLFCKINGSEQVFKLLTEEKYMTWRLRAVDKSEREAFLTTRKKYLLPSYN